MLTRDTNAFLVTRVTSKTGPRQFLGTTCMHSLRPGGVSGVCVLICFIKPILGNCYGPGVSSRASQGGTKRTKYLLTLSSLRQPVAALYTNKKTKKQGPTRLIGCTPLTLFSDGVRYGPPKNERTRKTFVTNVAKVALNHQKKGQKHKSTTSKLIQ